jgi:hypothetical protein
VPSVPNALPGRVAAHEMTSGTGAADGAVGGLLPEDQEGAGSATPDVAG